MRACIFCCSHQLILLHNLDGGKGGETICDVIKGRPSGLMRELGSYRTTLIAQKVKLSEVDRRRNLIHRRLSNNNNTVVSRERRNRSESKFQREKMEKNIK